MIPGMSESASHSHRLTRKLLSVGCLALPVLVIVGVIWAIITAHHVVELSNQKYPKWHMGDLLVEYLQDNDNQSPESWEQLEDRFPEHGLFGYSFEEIQTLICIDFSVSQDFICDHLDEILTGEIRLVSTCSGDNSHYERGDPNEIVAEYFKHIYSEKVPHEIQ